ncbi:uncharacterized protein RJT21DRAFT_123520 [Scheffersomyces amazonensis]|uniref:uncharacterized protein n=1 Tax=Scheffersomyces amazonensis TaxID=1078765 RepID=UPI00315CD835
MTRTNKWTVHEKQPEPKWFTHHGYIDSDPTKVKKEGAGKNNWGKPGDENNVNMYNQSNRRNSNHNENEMKLNEVDEKVNEKLL